MRGDAIKAAPGCPLCNILGLEAKNRWEIDVCIAFMQKFGEFLLF
jgi:hypothetical protein